MNDLNQFRKLVYRWPGGSLVRGSIAFGSRCVEPQFLRGLDLGQRLRRSLAKGRTHGEIRDIRDVASVFFAEENVDVVVLHSFWSSFLLIRIGYHSTVTDFAKFLG